MKLAQEVLNLCEVSVFKFKIGIKVKVLRGKFKGKIGKVVDWSEEDDQVDVKIGSETRFLGFNDVEIVK